jgi:hypothetical protein
MLVSQLAIATVSASPQPLENKHIPSPNQKLVAEIRSITAQFTEDTVEIRSRESGNLLLRYPMTSASGSTGRYVLKAEWSPDSAFFVFSSFSAGAHSSWNYRTFVYSLALNRFISIDELVRPVVDPNFKIISPHNLEVQTLNRKGVDAESVKTTIDLSALAAPK